MVVLSFLENLKDTASRLLPTPYMDILEEATLPQLSLPQYEAVVFLCDSANNKPENIPDVIRAVRRRINDADAKIQYLTILVLDALIKNCDIELHAEVATQKGLLRDLQNIATRAPCVTEKEKISREAALALILNMSIWFTGHPDRRVYILTTIADDVRHIIGPNAFEGIQPDTNTQLTVSLRRQQHQHSSEARTNARSRPQNNQQNQKNQQRAPIVDAIGINFPTEEELAAMLDCCMTLAEYLNNAEVQADGSVKIDDVIRVFQDKIRKDHILLTVILSSDLKVENRDVIRDISDSQTALIRRLENNGKEDITRISASQNVVDVADTEKYRPRVSTPTQETSSNNFPSAVISPAATATATTTTKTTTGASLPSFQIEPTAVETEKQQEKQQEEEKENLQQQKQQPSTTAVETNAMEDLFGEMQVQNPSAPQFDAESETVTATVEAAASPTHESSIETEEKEKEKESQQQEEEKPHEENNEDDFDAFLEGRLAK